jgi:hypothetical protein
MCPYSILYLYPSQLTYLCHCQFLNTHMEVQVSISQLSVSSKSKISWLDYCPSIM